MSARPIQMRRKLSRLHEPRSNDDLAEVEHKDVDGEDGEDDEYDESDDECMLSRQNSLSVSVLIRECDREASDHESDDDYDESDTDIAGELKELSVSVLMRECDKPEPEELDAPAEHALDESDDDDDAYDESSDEDLLATSPRGVPGAVSCPTLGTGSRYRLLELLSNGQGSRTLITEASPVQKAASPKAGMTPAQYRHQVAEELLESERRYCKYLHVITELFMEPMEEAVGSSGEMVSKEEFRSLFGGIKTMQKISEEFHRSLAVRLESWSEEQFIGDIVVKMVPLMGVYKTYKEQMHDRPKLLEQVRARSARFDSWCKVMMDHPTAEGLTLDTFLIMPVQRLPRILLLVENLLNATAETHGDHQNLADAAREVQSLMRAVNASDKNNLIYRLYALQGMAPECSGLLQPWRTYIAEFDVLLVGRARLPALGRPTHVPAGSVPAFPYDSTGSYRRRLEETIAEQQRKQRVLCIPHSNTEPNVMRGRKKKRLPGTSLSASVDSVAAVATDDGRGAPHRSSPVSRRRKGGKGKEGAKGQEVGKEGGSKDGRELRAYLCNDCIVYLGVDAAFCGKVSLLNTYIVDIPDCEEEGRKACFTLYNPSYCFTVMASSEEEKRNCIALVSDAIKTMRDSGIGLSSTKLSKDDLPVHWKDAVVLSLSQFSNFLFALDTELLGHPLFTRESSSELMA